MCVFCENNKISEVRLHILSNVGINKTGSVPITKRRSAFLHPLLLWKSNKYYIFGVCVCSLGYPACNAHVPYFIYGLSDFILFFHIFSYTARFSKKKVAEHKMCWFSVQRLSETVFILRRTERDMIKNVNCSSCKVPVILVAFQWNLSFSPQALENYSSTKFHENPSSWSRVVPCGRRDGQTGMTKLVGAFRNFANAPINKHSFFHTIYRTSFNKQQINPAV
jgi:hypothetical protein